MAGYIDNSSDLALFESYSQGRALAGASLTNLSPFAQWSALLDSKTCDWCGWADMRTFDTNVEPYDPPVHYGCRCIIAYITKDEFPPTADWGKGPPGPAWPPGRINGASASGQPVARTAEKLAKPPPGLVDPDLLDDVVESWKFRFGDDFDWDAIFPNEKINHTFLTEFNDETAKLLMGDKYNRAVQIDLEDLLSAWEAQSNQEFQAFLNAMSRGSVDDIMAAAGEAAGWAPDFGLSFKTLKEAATNPKLAEAFADHWKVRNAISSEIMKSTPLVKDGSVTVYRGVRSAKPGDFLDDMFKKLSAGDKDFAMGTEFIESWTTEFNAAEFYAGAARADVVEESFNVGIVFKKRVNANDMASTWLDQESFSWSGAQEVLWKNWDGTLVPKAIRKISDTLIEVEVW